MTLCMPVLHTLHACGIMKTNPIQLFGTVNFDRNSFKSVKFNLVWNHACTFPNKCNKGNSTKKLYK